MGARGEIGDPLGNARRHQFVDEFHDGPAVDAIAGLGAFYQFRGKGLIEGVVTLLQQEAQGPALRDTLIWFAAFALTAGFAIWFWPSLWSIPFFLAYGVLYGSSSDSRWHECGHGTAFNTGWMNKAVYGIAMFFAVPQVWAAVKSLFRHAAGRIGTDEATYIPESERPGVYAMARNVLAIHLAVIAFSLAIGSIRPVLLVGFLPTMYGAWLHVVTGLTQHAGLPEDGLDHRLNCRRVYMNPLLRFIYWNMNFHVEHHMIPMAPCHRLPELHEDMKPYCPKPYASTFAAYVEIVPAVFRQIRELGWYLRRELPESVEDKAAAQY
jgi:fatty acid desaturase